MYDSSSPLQHEFFQPLVTGWLRKIAAALDSEKRKAWQDVGDECEMFFSKSAAAMWDPGYQKKFWSGVAAPKFRITMNKAFELVAIYGPNLLWEVPHREVTPKRDQSILDDLAAMGPEGEQLAQQFAPMEQMSAAQDRIVAKLMERYLNYGALEQPGGGLAEHSHRCVTDALIRGRGVLAMRPYSFPESDRRLTGAFRIDPRDLILDPDFDSISEAKWIAIKHTEPHWEVERRFRLPKDALKGRSTLESSWSRAEASTQLDGGNPHRAAGLSNDLVVWYEVYSRNGVGARMTGMDDSILGHLETVVRDYAYLAICANVPYPLNCSHENVRNRESDQQIKARFDWPVPLWKDNRFPVEVLDFYIDPSSPYPVPPMAPAMGELKFLNFMISWMANRVHSSSRDFWAVAGPHVEHYKKWLEQSADQAIIPTPVIVDDVNKAIKVLQQPEMRMDTWRIIELVSEMFDKRTGLTEFQYGRNESGTQDRTAETTRQRAHAAGVRPQFMQKRVVDWQSNVASVDAFMARFFVRGQDIEPLIGQVGRVLWEKHIMSTDVELVVRQMTYRVAASSVQRPDNDRKMEDLDQLINSFAGVLQKYGNDTGDYEPMNAILKKWGELRDMDLSEVKFQPPQQDEAAAQAQQQQMELEMQKLQIDLQKAQMELQGKQIEVQGKQVDQQGKQQAVAMTQQQAAMKLQTDQQAAVLKIEAEQQRAAQQIEADQQASVMGIIADGTKFEQEQEQDRLKFLQDLSQDRVKFEQEQRHRAQQARAQAAAAKNTKPQGSAA